MPSPIDSPCVWTGEELAGREDWLNAFDGEQRVEVGRLLEDPDADSPALAELFAGLRDSLEEGSGAVLLRGLPVAGLDEAGAKALFLRLASMLGTPVSQSAGGELVFSVRDAGFKDDDPRSRGPNTRKRLTFHSDRCDIIGFLCLKQAKVGGGNDIASSAAIHNHLLETRPDLVDQLYEPFYYQRHNVDTGNERAFCRQPVFSVTGGKFACNLLRVLIDRAHANPELPDLTEDQIEALDAVEETAALPEMHASFRQEPGDMVFLNNWVTLHRRSEFEDHPEPELRRHILRAWISPPNNRPLDPLFRDNYGAVEAGAVRGGMRQAR